MSLAECDANLKHCHLQNLWPRAAEPQRLLGSYAQEGLAFVAAPISISNGAEPLANPSQPSIFA